MTRRRMRHMLWPPMIWKGLFGLKGTVLWCERCGPSSGMGGPGGGGLLKVLLLRLIRIINFVSKLRGIIHILPQLMLMLLCCCCWCCSRLCCCYCYCRHFCLFRGKIHPTRPTQLLFMCVYLLFPFMFIHWIYDIIVAYFAAPSQHSCAWVTMLVC